MALTIGTQLGSHEITALLGKGGMGEVYRARDLKLKREVAIKILPEEFSRDDDRVSRFQREAEVLASLNHPNIAAIYDFQEANDRRFLVLELVEGETLAEQIQRGPVPIEGALEITKHICEALEAAHEKGVVHRDLKPANVKITPDGRVKVLDFGLAKAMEIAPASDTLSNSPTLRIGATQAGVILGTAAYMSPEQAKGWEVDARSDTFAFGSVLYEMLTGRKAFQGDTVAEVLASVLVREPDFSLLPPNLNPRIQELLQRCLQKNPKRRWQAVGDLRAELEIIAAAPRLVPVLTQPVAYSQPPWKRAVLVLVTAILVSAAATIVTWRLTRPSPASVIRFSMMLPEEQIFTSGGSRQLAVSPDGTRLVYVANNQLFMRAMEETEAHPIPGTNGQVPSSPFFSPDAQWVGFYSRQDSTFKKISIRGGVAQVICKANGKNAIWAGDQIVFSSSNKGIMRVSANGGEPEVIAATKPPEEADNPQILDNGQALLFGLSTETGPDRWDKGQIVVQSLRTGKRMVVLPSGSSAQYIPTGHLVYTLGGTLFAIPFDLKTLQVRGGPVPVIEGVERANIAVSGVAMFAFSANGSLFYVPGAAEGSFSNQALAFVDRAGHVQPLPLSSEPLFLHPRISPDGNQIVFGTYNKDDAAIWIYDLKGGGAPRRLTFGGLNSSPIWSPDGRRVAFQSDNREGGPGIFWEPAEGGKAERLTTADSGTGHMPQSWTSDGKVLLLSTVKQVADVWSLAMDGDRKPMLLLGARGSSITSSELSPDDRWVAYSSKSGARPEIFVEPFPPTGTKYQISTDSGGWPRWSPDGKQLYYVHISTNRLLAVSIHTEPPFGVGKPTVIGIDRANFTVTSLGRNYDITPDGKQFLVVMPAVTERDLPSKRTQQFNVVLNWFDELKHRVPVQ